MNFPYHPWYQPRHMSPPATRWVPLVEQELLIIPEFFSGFPYGSCCSMLCLLYSVLRTLACHCFSFGHCIFWFYLPLWCLQPIVIGREDHRKKLRLGVQAVTKDRPHGVQGQHLGGRPGGKNPRSSWILAFLSIAEGISKVSFFWKIYIKWKKVNFSTKIY